MSKKEAKSKSSKINQLTPDNNDQPKVCGAPPKPLLTEPSSQANLTVPDVHQGNSFSYKNSSAKDEYLDTSTSNCRVRRGKVSIIGMGMVGSSYAYSLIQSGLATELVLVDKNPSRLHGEYLDLSHCLSFVPSIKLTKGELSDCKDSQIVVISAGISQQDPSESRLSLVMRNVAVLEKIIPQIIEYAPACNIIIATNPVDILVSYCEKLIDSLHTPFYGSVLGSGTVLDSARFTYLISQHFHINISNVHAMIIGEHGDSEIPVWSRANIAGMSLDDYSKRNGIEFNDQIKSQIFTNTKDAAKQIISTKGATYYAIGLSLLRISEAIMKNSYSILNVSGTKLDLYGIDPKVAISFPSIVNSEGIHSRIRLKLDENEQVGFKKSASILKDIIDDL